MRIVQAVLALAAALFGIATIIAGVRVLIGFHPGYTVFWPLLIYNTAMGGESAARLHRIPVEAGTPIRRMPAP